MKTKTIRLSYPHSPRDTSVLYDPALTQEERAKAFDAARRYRVEQVGDSAEPNPGDYLERRDVERLCRDSAWKVTIVNPK